MLHLEDHEEYEDINLKKKILAVCYLSKF